MHKIIVCKEIAFATDGRHHYRIFLAALQPKRKTLNTWRIACKEGTSYQQFVTAVAAAHDVAHVWVQETLWADLPEQTLIGMDVVTGSRYRFWRNT